MFHGFLYVYRRVITGLHQITNHGLMVSGLILQVRNDLSCSRNGIFTWMNGVSTQQFSEDAAPYGYGSIHLLIINYGMDQWVIINYGMDQLLHVFPHLPGEGC